MHRVLVHTRPFVSSVLLSRSWENETVATLKKEARLRGLSLKGNKATLIMRIQEHDEANTNETLSARRPSATAAPRRPISTEPSSSSSTAPGVPHASHPVTSASQAFMNITIPDTRKPNNVPPVQIPYVPDFWSSNQRQAARSEEPLPKLLVVAGAATHPGGGPSHNLVDGHGTFEEGVSPSTEQDQQKDLIDDIVEDLGLPPIRDMKRALSRLFSRNF